MTKTIDKEMVTGDSTYSKRVAVSLEIGSQNKKWLTTKKLSRISSAA
jgi:hypothetical protein